MDNLRKYAYSISFLIVAIGFAGLIKQHWAAVVPMMVCILFAIENYSSFNNDLGSML